MRKEEKKMTLNAKIRTLNKEDLHDLESCCKNVLILGGLKTCQALSLKRFEKMLRIPKKALLKWFRKNNKNFVKEFCKKG